MNYNDRNPTFSFRLSHLLNQRLTKMAKLYNETTNEHARTILSKYLKGELVEKQTDDKQEKLLELRIEKLKLENKYLQIKCDFADNFHAPISQSASHFLKPKPMIINKTQTEEFQSPYDASNKRLQCVDCGILFCWNSYDEYKTQMQKFQRHLSEDHKRKMNETEKEVITYISYEGNST